MSAAAAAFAGAVVTAFAAYLVNYFAPGFLARLMRRPPLYVLVERDPSVMYAGAPNWVGSSFVLPKGTTPEALGEPPSDICRDWRSWMWPKGAFDADYTELRVVLQGNSDSTVLVDGLRVMIVERAAPTGVAVRCLVGGADITPRRLDVDLDWEPGVVTYVDDGGESGKAFSFALSKGDVEVFHIEARTSSSKCRWVAELLLVVNGKREAIYIDDDGDAFRTSATGDLPVWQWSGAAWQASAEC